MLPPRTVGPKGQGNVVRGMLAKPKAPAFKSMRPRHSFSVVAQSGSGGSSKPDPEPTALAPAKPRTPYGEMLTYYLTMEPELFKTAVEDQLGRLRDEKEAREKEAKDIQSNTSSLDLTLSKRMEEVRAMEKRAALEDLMYVCILEKFVTLGVEMLPRLDGFVDVSPTNLKALTEGIHSKEALELVREHLMSVMGPATLSQFSNAALKMSKFQMAQIYCASIMFGYFLRRVDTRFQLEKSVGTLPVSREDAVARLERLFSQVDAEEAPWEENLPSSPSSSSSTSSSASPPNAVSGSQGSSSSSRSSSSSSATSASGRDTSAAGAWAGAPLGSGDNLPARKSKSALRRYVESFDQATMVETARIVSVEGAGLVERQTSAVLGDIKKLTAQIQEAVGSDASSMEEVMARMARAVQNDSVETLTMTVGTQRRAVLEAVAFGTFLRDVETHVDQDYNLLERLPPPRLPPANGMGGAGEDFP